MKFSKYFDHTLLKPEATSSQIDELCKEAKDYDFASVCINPYWVKRCAENLNNTDVNVCTVIGFPLGAVTTEDKVNETKNAIKNGADEIDMVINVGELKDQNYPAVIQDIRDVKKECGKHVLKVIIETCLLTDEEKKKACECVVSGGADYVKTSTGFSKAGATKEDIELMKNAVGNSIHIKAAGGIHTLQDVNNMIDAGADRIGASASVKIMQEVNEQAKKRQEKN